VFFFARRQFGKVITPLTVFSARMPVAFMSFYGKLPKLDKRLQLPSQTAELIRERVASINTCLFCMDATRWYAMKTNNTARFDALEEYQTSSLFTDAERAALDYATELTRNKQVSPEHVCATHALLQRAGDLRHRVACCKRAPVQHDQHRTQHRFRRSL